MATPGNEGTRKKVVWFLSWNAMWAVLIIGGLESLCIFLLNNPPRNSTLLVPLREYYLAVDRNIIQWDEGCSRYDAELKYTLKPPGCVFSSREFSVTFEVNSLGYRDDESSLHSPEIIVTGDSYALGWGVRNDETFASHIERATGLKTLNMAMSSYSTAAEMLALRRVSLDNLKWLIVQYAENDHGENNRFMEQGGQLRPVSEGEYDAVVARMKKTRAYYPGKHTGHLVPLFVRHLRTVAGGGAAERTARTTDPGIADQIKSFLFALNRSIELPPRVQVLVLSIPPERGAPDFFHKELAEAVSSRTFDDGGSEIQVVKLASHLTVNDYFRLDDHLTAKGHEKIAKLLCEFLPCKE